jgi:hypothetical protein
MPISTKRIYDWLQDNPDETILRWVLRSLMVATVAVLAADLAGQNGWINQSASIATPPGRLASAADGYAASIALDLAASVA